MIQAGFIIRIYQDFLALGKDLWLNHPLQNEIEL